MIKEKDTEKDNSVVTEKPASSMAASSSSVSAKSKKKKAKKPKMIASSDSSASEWDEEPTALIDFRFEDLGTQERSKIRSFKNFYRVNFR